MTRAIAARSMRVGKPLGLLIGATTVAFGLACSSGCNNEPANVPGSIKADKKTIQLDPFANDNKNASKEQLKDRTKTYDQQPAPTPDKK